METPPPPPCKMCPRAPHTPPQSFSSANQRERDRVRERVYTFLVGERPSKWPASHAQTHPSPLHADVQGVLLVGQRTVQAWGRIVVVGGGADRGVFLGEACECGGLLSGSCVWQRWEQWHQLGGPQENSGSLCVPDEQQSQHFGFHPGVCVHV